MKRAVRVGLSVFVLGVTVVVGARACGGYGAAPAPWIPMQEGARWTFRVSELGAVTSATEEVQALTGRAPAEARLDFGGRADPQAEASRDVSGAPILAFDGGERGALLVAAQADGSVLVGREFWGTTIFAEHLRIPADVAPGATWSGTVLVPSCGYMELAASFSAHRERISVPAGTFDALRIDVVAPWGVGTRYEESLWLVRGVGLVKWTDPWFGGETWELVSTASPRR